MQLYVPIEMRAKEVDGKPTYVVKGYAATKDTVYPYKTTKNRTFKEFFSQKALDNIKNKLSMEKVFVDAEHQIGTKNNAQHIVKKLKAKIGTDFAEELDFLDRSFKYSDIPMFKVQDIQIDDKGLFVEVRGNPFYREMDEDHRKYFDSVWSSIESGFINGMSLNMKPTAMVQAGEDLTQIDDVDIYGISLTGSPANPMTSITEVAMRSINRGEQKCQNRLMLMR